MNHSAYDQPQKDTQAASFRAALHSLYSDLDKEILQEGPICELSGRCCRFKEFGHTLFLSAPEFEMLSQEAPPPVRPIDQGETCPWQDIQGRCTAREARPLGCRVYFCDQTFQEKGYELTERYIDRLKRLVDDFGLAWNYAPLHAHLQNATEIGPNQHENSEPITSTESPP